jgi:hypothetical protein
MTPPRPHWLPSVAVTPSPVLPIPAIPPDLPSPHGVWLRFVNRPLLASLGAMPPPRPSLALLGSSARGPFPRMVPDLRPTPEDWLRSGSRREAWLRSAESPLTPASRSMASFGKTPRSPDAGRFGFGRRDGIDPPIWLRSVDPTPRPCLSPALTNCQGADPCKRP